MSVNFRIVGALAAAMVGLVDSAAWAAPLSYSAAVLNSSPYAYYRFNENSGQSAIDSSGNSRSGTYIASPTLQQVGGGGGVDLDKAVSFNGASQYLSSTATGFGTSIPTSSYEFLFKVNAGFSTSAIQSLFGCYNNADATAVDINLNENYQDKVTANTVRFFARDKNNANVKASFTSESLFDGHYHHLLITYNGVKNVSVYVDGVAQTVTAAGAGASATTAFGFSPSFAGDNGRGTVVNFANVTLDEAALYTSVLTSADAATHAIAIPEPAMLGFAGMAASGVLLCRRKAR